MKKYAGVMILLLCCFSAVSLANAQVKPSRIRVSAQVAAGLVKKRVPPEYPQEAKDKHLEGSVILQVIIDKEGNVSDATVFSGDPILTPASIDAVKKWKYRPFLLNGEPVVMETQVTVTFTLNK